MGGAKEGAEVVCWEGGREEGQIVEVVARTSLASVVKAGD